jgi:hypothetical protein
MFGVESWSTLSARVFVDGIAKLPGKLGTHQLGNILTCCFQSVVNSLSAVSGAVKKSTSSLGTAGNLHSFLPSLYRLIEPSRLALIRTEAVGLQFAPYLVPYTDKLSVDCMHNLREVHKRACRSPDVDMVVGGWNVVFVE